MAVSIFIYTVYTHHRCRFHPVQYPWTDISSLISFLYMVLRLQGIMDLMATNGCVHYLYRVYSKTSCCTVQMILIHVTEMMFH